MSDVPADVPTVPVGAVNDPSTPTTYPIPDDLLPLFMDGGKFVPDLWWWGFDTFMTRLVCIAADMLLDRGFPCHHIIPGDADCHCKEEWRTYLRDIRDDLAGYDKYASTATEEQYTRVQEALRRFIDRMGAWWD